MTESHAEFIDIDRLRIGHFVFLDLGWISHPFPLNSFRIQSQGQIDTLRSLGIERIRYSPERSEPEPDTAAGDETPPPPGDSATAAAPRHEVQQRLKALLAEEQARLQACERMFTAVSRSFRHISEAVVSRPQEARETAQALVADMVGSLAGGQESLIRLLSEKAGEKISLHAVNVTVLSLLLGKACGLDEAALQDLGCGALLHDIGKVDLPDRVRYQDEHVSPAERQLYQDHVRYGVARGKKMHLPAGPLQIIAQHHEQADGSGFPQHLGNGQLSPAARIVALVNRYDNLANPGNPALALTPHEALSHIFTRAKHRFDEEILTAFIRMMGVYPPGSLVQLSDQRYALVISVNSSRPLKPRVLVHSPGIPREEALPLELAEEPRLCIRRSVKPLQLPKATFDYLSPRQRICYFFEHARGLDRDQEEPR